MPLLDRRSLILGGLALAGTGGRVCCAEDRAGARLLADDTRLGKPVDLRMKRASLSEVLAALQRGTGARMTATADIADEPALVFVAGQPTREVMRQLALLFNFRWRRTGKPGGYRYDLYEDTASRREEAALLAEGQGRIIAALQNEVRLSLELIKNPRDEVARQEPGPGTPPEQALGRLLEGDTRSVRALRLEEARRSAATQRVRTVADPRQRIFLRLAAALTAAQWESMLEGERIIFSTRDEAGTLPMPPLVRAALASGPPARILPGERFARPEDEEAARREERVARDLWALATGYRVACEITRLSRREGPPAQLAVRPGAIAEDGQATLWARNPNLAVDWPLTDEPPDPEIPDGDGQSDPILALRRRWNLGVAPNRSTGWWAGWLTQVLPSLAESFGLNLIADAYRIQRSVPPGGISRDELPLHAVLSRYILPAAHVARDGAFVRIRRQQWYDVRRSEIPDRVAEEWAGFLRTRPRLSVDGFAALALAFRDEQLEETFEAVMRDQGVELPELMDQIDYPRLGGGRALLRTYGSLPPPLRERLLAGQALSMAALPPAARHWLEAALRGHSTFTVPPPSDQIAAGELRLNLYDLQREVTQSGEDFVIEYRFTGGGERPMQNGAPLFPSGRVQRSTTPVAPPPGGQAIQAAQFRFAYGGNSLDWIIILPWIHVLPPRADAPSAPPKTR
jgi:hypothetical protein